MTTIDLVRVEFSGSFVRPPSEGTTRRSGPVLILLERLFEKIEVQNIFFQVIARVAAGRFENGLDAYVQKLIANGHGKHPVIFSQMSERCV